MAEITVTIKCSNADKADISCATSITVLELKQLVAEKLNVPSEQQRLIYKGRILKDESTLEQYDIQTGHTIHMVKSGGGAQSNASSSPSTSTATAPPTAVPSQPNAQSAGGAQPLFPGFGNPFASPAGFGDLGQYQNQLMQNPEMLQQMLNSPLMQSILNNPEMMNSMILNNPQLQSMMDANPQIRHILNDPELMRQSLQMMSNPNAMQEAMRHQDLAMSRLENHPEGFNALRRMYEDVQEPLMEATQNALRNPAQTTQQGQQAQSNPWASGTPNTAALPNPWGQRAPANPFTPNSGAGMAANQMPGLGFGGFPQMGAGGAGGFPGMPNMNDPAALSAMMQNPMVQQMLQNPELMMQMARMDPQLNSMLQANPQLQAALTDPETLRRMADPNNLQALMQLQQSMQQLQRTGLIPPGAGMPMGGFGGLGGGGMFPPNFPMSAPPAPTSANANANTNTTIGGLDFSSILGRGGQPTGAGVGAAPSAASFNAPPSATSRSPEVRFESQLQQLEGMGFTDRDANIRALIASNGNVNAAVERLLQ